MEKKIKWACIQPLTGGMYIGAEEAIGHPAEWILSFKGLNDVKFNNNGDISVAANEYNLIKYLESHNKMPKYYQINNRGMFDANVDDIHIEITDEDNIVNPDYTDLDLIVAVPVCSGLSMVTSGSKETKDTKNSNMIWITNYTLNVIKPKIYIFENAPTMMGSRGDGLRTKLEEMAKDANYSVLYYKTNTSKHSNCQNRPRTFIIFQKHIKDGIQRPVLYNFENKHIDVVDFFNSISDNLFQSEPVSTAPYNLMIIDYYTKKFGREWMDTVFDTRLNFMQELINHSLLDDFINYIDSSNEWNDIEKEKSIKYIRHIQYKKSLGLNYYGDDIQFYNNDVFPSIQFRSIHNLLHPSGKRTCTTRELLSLMGMPEDFILYGNESNLAKIGQNVPVKTAKFITEEAVKILLNWNSEQQINDRDSDVNAAYINNINETIELVN